MLFKNDIIRSAGLRINGWHYSWQFCQEKIKNNQMVVLVAETSNICNQDCEYCFTQKESCGDGCFSNHRKLTNELSLSERLDLIDQASRLGAVSYDVVGAGEPFLDECFYKQIEYAYSCNMVPLVATNGIVLGNFGDEHLERLQKFNVSVIVKWHSRNNNLHDYIVHRQGAGVAKDRAINLLMQAGFNKTTPTRLGIDDIIYKRTLPEIIDCLRFCRQNNILLVGSSFIPSGRTQKGYEQECSFDCLVNIFQQCQQIDRDEFGRQHSAKMPYIGYGKTCIQYFGLYVAITGDIYDCVGQTHCFGNIRQVTLKSAWQQKLGLLQKYNGGCPPREKYYRSLGTSSAKLRRFF